MQFATVWPGLPAGGAGAKDKGAIPPEALAPGGAKWASPGSCFDPARSIYR